MDAIREQYGQLKQDWQRAYEALAPNPAAYQPHLTGASLEQLNEAVKTVGYWLDRTRAPKGFAPGFHLSRSLAATALAGAIISAQALARGEYPHFPAFVVAINQCLSALNTMVLFADPDDARKIPAELSAKLAEALSLQQTAQKELATKVKLLDDASTSLSTLKTIADQIEDWSKAAEAGAKAVGGQRDSAKESLTQIGDSAKEVNELHSTVAALLERTQEANEQLAEREADLQRVIEKAKEQEKLISDLLPKGASAGLASAFAGRVGQLEKAKWIWVSLFVVSMGGLFFLGLRIIDLYSSGAATAAGATSFWELLLRRLPLAAPMVWLGWFSAVQYGNSLRVQEDYAFKEATSKAFAGYRDHMEHLANVNLAEGNTAMLLMAQRTIDILAHEPLRIFQGIENDAAPTEGILAALMPGRKKPEPPVSSKPA